MLLLIDNYDSFTHNIARYFQQLGETVLIKRHDAIRLNDIKTLSPQRIVISPGPCTPNEAGISLDVIRQFAATIPILGICLGHQCLAQVYGGNIIRAPQVMHGKTSNVYHKNQGIFANIDNPFVATRYHSLIVALDSVPSCLTVSARTQNEDGTLETIMGLQHNTLPLFGVQFHPEAILTTAGLDVLRGFLISTQ